MESLSNEAQALGIIRQLYPFLLVICFVGLVIFDFALRLPPKEGAVLPKWRFLVQSLVVLTIFTYVGEAAAYVVRSLVQRGWWAGQTKVVFVLSSILVWGIMSLILVDSTTPRWLPYTGTWATALALEITVFVLSDTVETEKSAFHVFERAVAISRILMVFALSMLGIKIEWTCKRKLSSADEENQPLLGADANGTAETQRDCKNYGTTETTEETETEEREDSFMEEQEEQKKKTQEKLRQRVLDQGGWWGYTKQFFIFLPLIWPARNRKMQFYLFIITLCILAERAFNLLIPRQIGIITNKLTEDRGTHHVPWKEISIWIGLRVLKSRAGVDGVMVLVQCLLTQFAYSRLTVAAFRHVMGLSMDFHNDKSSGELLKSVEQGHSLTSLVEYLFVDTAPLLIDLVVVFVYLANLFDGYLAFTVVVVAVTYIWTAIKLTTLNRTGRRRWVDKYVKENKILYESVSNWQTVAYFNRAGHEESRLSVAIDEHIDAYVRYIFFYNIVFAVEGLIMLLGLLVVSFLAAYRISEGTATVGSFVMLMSYWATLSSPLSRLASCYNKLSSDLIDAERMLELFQTKSSVPEQPDAPDLHVNEARVEFQNVSYAYDERKPAIKDISFAAEPGQTIALVGETGSGKSTTLKLLMRFYDVSPGSIQIDGQDIRHVKLDSLRESMGVVPQDPSMFNLSIMENIRYARLDATDEEIYDACRAAAVHDKIMTFPDKYRSKVGERGVKLSGGELQRIAIARVLIKSPQLVLLDEATSAVDSETEVQIQEAFRRLSRGRTTFVVAHRLSTVMDADLILVMNEGSIIERGTHQELLAHGGKYLMLWTKQTSSRRHADSECTTVEASDDELLLKAPESSNGNYEGNDTIIDQVDGAGNSKPNHSEASSSDESATCLAFCTRKKGKTQKGSNASSHSGSSTPPAGRQRAPNAPLQKLTPKPTYGTQSGVTKAKSPGPQTAPTNEASDKNTSPEAGQKLPVTGSLMPASDNEQKYLTVTGGASEPFRKTDASSSRSQHSHHGSDETGATTFVSAPEYAASESTISTTDAATREVDAQASRED
ncbi:hypothetical protein IWZ03DRAFT_415124 [Phyllosticta citriasiana]|uniref:Heavy metal tolerance protein n=1 Tax=Phyllosticta citriasiana TaxID=595635 RepID=A0ABR1KQG6_9PEZI